MRRNFTQLLSLALTLGVGMALQAEAPQTVTRTSAAAPGGDRVSIVERATRRAVLAQAREAAAVRTKAAMKAKGGKVDPATLGVNPAGVSMVTALAQKASGVEAPVAQPGPGFQLRQPDYMFGTATNWHNTKPIRKFVDGLAGLGAAQANNLGNYIPFAVPDRATYSNSDYYQVDVVEYMQKMHSDLNPTRLRGYQDHTATALNTLGAKDLSGNTLNSSYLGPIIIAKKDRAVRMKVRNLLPFGPVNPSTGRRPGDLFIPVDTTMMGAGLGPNGGSEVYTENRAEFHLHGGLNPWISDGTPHQWVTPAGETTSYKKGAAFQNVPDMGAGTNGDGIATYFYSNQQSGRMLWYHDHAYGLTRLNVYVGEAAGYLIVDPVETRLINAGILPSQGSTLPISEDPWDTAPYNASTHPVHPPLFEASTGQVQNVYAYGIPLVIQDKTFVDTSTLGTVGVRMPDGSPATDPTWSISAYGGDGSLWYPHVYIPNQNPADISGANAMGRWDYGPWFWPPLTAAAGLLHGAEPIPQDPNGTEIPGTPNPSLTPEAFMDTPVINGVAYPTITVQPTAYRFRILNGANDRFWNLSFFLADPAAPTEVSMVDAAPNPAWPASWPTDGRAGGVPDPATAGPSFVQIGNESGFLAAPAVIAPQPVAYNYNRRDIVVLNVADHGLFLGPAERADVVVDFSAFAGKTLILYNDAPAPVPAFDARLDYYTGDPDQRDSGGANTTLAGYGPNTRTVMQFVVANTTPAPTFDVARLVQAFVSTDTYKGAFAEAQHLPIVPQLAYYQALNKPLTAGTNASFANDVYFRIQDFQARYPFPAMENGVSTQPLLESKAIQELFELNYGRMNATLGIELPRTNFNIQTTIPLGYTDNATEILEDGTTQYWKITHNGVDTHPVHFHLFDVQVINRVGWDGAVRMPEANELGWKETVKMSPLEDIIVAFRPLSPRLPFVVPLSSRELDVTQPNNVQVTFTDPLTGNPISGPNTHQNFGWEYVWHCHILGHEENDFMRPMVLNVATTVPNIPTNLGVAAAGSGLKVSWNDRSTNETGFSIERGPSASGPWTEIATTVPNQNSYTDLAVVPGTTYFYRVASYNQKGSSAYTTAVSKGSTAGLTLSGFVGTFDGTTSAPMPGVSLAFSNAGGTTTTAANGSYSHNLALAWAGTITPTLAGYAFTPASQTWPGTNTSPSSLDFVARKVYTISGTVYSGSTPLPGVTLTLSNGGGSATTNAAGTYTVAVDEFWTGTATPAKANYSFAPAFSSYPAVRANQTTNYAATGVVTVSGTITTSGGSPASNVQVFYGPLTSVVTDAAGKYSVTVPSPWTGTISPTQVGQYFTPASQTYTAITTDQTQNYTVSGAILFTGTVLNTGGSALAGVRLTASSGHTATTLADGTYSLYLPNPFTGTVAASLTGYTFSTVSPFVAVTVDTPLVNFTGTAALSISGRVTLNALGLAGATITLSTGQVAQTDVNGNYTVWATAPFTGNVTATATGYFLSPTAFNLVGAATNQAGVNFTAVPAIPITGQILAGGSPLANVAVTLSNGAGSVITNASGIYSATVPSRWTGTITPTLAGYTFTPALRNLTNVTVAPAAQNFTAAAVFTISGGVTNGATPLANVRLTFSNAGGTATTTAAGTYTITLPAGWTGTITPVLRGYTFGPLSLTIPALGGSLTGQNFNTVQTISGRAVNRAGTGIAGVAIAFTGGTTVVTPATGNFTLTVPTGWTGTITASGGALATWAPASFNYSNVTAAITGIRFTGQ